MEEKNVNQASGEKLYKSWQYTEKYNKHETHHTLSIQGKRFTHTAEIKEASQAMKQRTDFNLDNVRQVNSYYGLSRNIVAVVLLVLLAIACFALVIAGFAGEMMPLGFVGLVLVALFILLAVLVYKRIKPAFILEIETAVPMSTLTTNAFAYGSATVNFGKKKHSPLFYLILVVLWPIGILYLLFGRKGGNKYKFIMDPETGMDIVDTIGSYLIQE